MAYIPMVEYEQASEAAKKEFEDQIEKNGRITNMKRTLLHSLPSFHALMEWYPLRDEAAKFLSEREINLFCHAISTENDCLVCSTFFRKIITDSGQDPDNVQLSPREALLTELGQLSVKDPGVIADALMPQLKETFSDEQIVVLISFAGLMIATNLINNALQVPLDEYLQSYTRR